MRRTSNVCFDDSNQGLEIRLLSPNTIERGNVKYKREGGGR